MKIACTTSGTDLDAPLDKRFGRAPRFLIVDTETGSTELIENTLNRNSAQGAGIQAATVLINHEVNSLITGQCGPKAFELLKRSAIRVYPCQAETVAEALQQLADSTLNETAAATVEGHWS